MGKIVENMAIEGADPKPPAIVEIVVVDDSEPELEVEESGSKVIAELAPL